MIMRSMTTHAWAPVSSIMCHSITCRRQQPTSSSSSFFQLASTLDDDNMSNDNESLEKEEEKEIQPDDDCEDECDIDWDAMPGWDEEKEPKTQQAAAVASSEPSPETLRLRLEMAWQQDEAQEDCDIEEPVTCGSEPCNTCRGRGWSDCRFCHGTMLLRNSHAKISMGMGGGTGSEALSSTTTTTTRTRTKWSLPCDTFTPCRICHQGVETCSSCKGSGWVAGWTQLSNEQQPHQQH